MDDNTDKIWAEVDVHPDHRGRGAGTALARVLERRARELGRPRSSSRSTSRRTPPAITRTSGSPPPTATRQRAPRTCGSSTFRSRTTSSTGSRRARERWGDAYRLETYTDGLPDELVAGYCRVSNLLNVDAPTGAVDFEAETLTPERYRGYLDLERRQGDSG